MLREASLDVSGAPVVGTMQAEVIRGSRLLAASAAPTKIARAAKRKVSVSFMMLWFEGLCSKVLIFRSRSILMVEFACALRYNSGLDHFIAFAADIVHTKGDEAREYALRTKWARRRSRKFWKCFILGGCVS